MSDPVDIAVIVPRIRRALEGAGTAPVLSDDDVAQLAADAIAEVILFTGGVFGKQLLVTEYDPPGIPKTYATDEALTLPEQAVIAYQAAINHFFFALRDVKVSETIRDEGQEWSYSLSAQVLRDQLQLLRDERDRALMQVQAIHFIPSAFVSFIESRDYATSRLIEPYAASGLPKLPQLGAGGQDVDYRFE